MSSQQFVTMVAFTTGGPACSHPTMDGDPKKPPYEETCRDCGAKFGYTMPIRHMKNVTLSPEHLDNFAQHIVARMVWVAIASQKENHDLETIKRWAGWETYRLFDSIDQTPELHPSDT